MRIGAEQDIAEVGRGIGERTACRRIDDLPHVDEADRDVRAGQGGHAVEYQDRLTVAGRIDAFDAEVLKIGLRAIQPDDLPRAEVLPAPVKQGVMGNDDQCLGGVNSERRRHGLGRCILTTVRDISTQIGRRVAVDHQGRVDSASTMDGNGVAADAAVGPSVCRVATAMNDRAGDRAVIDGAIGRQCGALDRERVVTPSQEDFEDFKVCIRDSSIEGARADINGRSHSQAGNSVVVKGSHVVRRA